MNPVNVDALPTNTKLIARKLGMQQTYNLLVKHGAQCFAVPAKFSLECALVKSVGKESAEALIALFPGKFIDLPKPDKILLQWRDKELIHDYYELKIPVMKLVKKYNITRQRINQIINEQDDDQNYLLPL